MKSTISMPISRASGGRVEMGRRTETEPSSALTIASRKSGLLTRAIPVPSGAPDSVQPPAESFKDFLPQPVPVTCNEARVIGRSIAFDSERPRSRAFRVCDRHVDPVAEVTDLRLNDKSPTTDRLEHLFFKR